MRAVRTYAKKKECVNAPIGPFTTFSHCACGCNIRNELISAAKNTEHQYQYDELDSLASDGGVAYAYDAAGNRTTKTENGETITYTLGLSDGLASWMSMGSSSMGSPFAPLRPAELEKPCGTCLLTRRNAKWQME